MIFTFRPLTTWPRAQTKGRKTAPFRAGYDDTRRLLLYELEQINTREAIVQIALDASQIRRDGMPYADARVNFPGVIVTAVTSGKAGTLNFPCDRYTSWQDNLRAIARSLEALRMVDRYGVTRSGEQYRGWNALPPGPIVTPAVMTIEQAAHFLAHACDGKRAAGWRMEDIIAHEPAFCGAYREAAKELHPDATQEATGEAWHKLQQAKEVLKKHHAQKGHQ